MSKTTVYLHFRTKQELFKAALDNLFEQLPHASELTSGITGDSLEERLVVVAERASRLISSPYFELIRRSIDADLPPSLREHVRAAAGLPHLQAIRDYLNDEAARGFLVFEDATSAASSFIALIAGPEVLRSRWSGATFGPINDAHLHYAVKVFVRGHARQYLPPHTQQETRMSLNPRALMLAATLLATSPLMAGNLSNPTINESTVLAQAQEMQNRTSAEKRAFIERQLTLSPQQAEKFWPIYEEGQVALGELNRRRIENILAYARAWNQGSLDDKTANALAKEVIEIEEDEVALLKRTYRHASKAATPAQAALYVQIEAKLRARLRFEETEMLPLVK